MSEIEMLRLQNEHLKKALQDTLWMASEYVKKSDRLFSPYQLNRAIDVAIRSRIPLRNTCYINDKLLGKWDSRLGRFISQSY